MVRGDVPARLATLFSVDAYAEVEATCRCINALAGYREPDRKFGRIMMTAMVPLP